MNTLDIYIEKGRKEGVEEGAAQKSCEVVKNLLSASKFSISEIAEFAGVSEAFVKKLHQTADDAGGE